MPITELVFKGDRHANRYLGTLNHWPSARDRLFEILNGPENEQRLLHASEFGLPALRGIVHQLESDEAILPALTVLRFRQAVGVAVRLKMAQIGWATTGEKKAMTGSKYFRLAERYKQAPQPT